MTIALDPATLVAELGFLLRRDIPTAGHDALLVVALRPDPTERHFDPECVQYWRTGANGLGYHAQLTCESSMPQSVDFSWGPIEVADRFGVSNTFAALGGTLTASRNEVGAVVATFRSRGPILRRGGHSQRYDGIAAALSGFFARLRVPVVLRLGAERLLSAATPVTRYAAFLQHEVPRLGIQLVRDAYGPDARLVRVEAERLRRRDPVAWDRGAELLAQLGLSQGNG